MVPNIRPLETLHNSLSLNQITDFFDEIIRVSLFTIGDRLINADWEVMISSLHSDKPFLEKVNLKINCSYFFSINSDENIVSYNFIIFSN